MSTPTPPTRGKFLNKPPVRGKFLRSPGANLKNSSSGAQNGNSSSSTASSAKRKATPLSDEASKLFDDLDEAEELTLQLLQVASDSADALGNIDEVDKLLQGKGEEYLKTVGRIHALLAKHARLVVPYKRTKEVSEKKDKVGDKNKHAKETNCSKDMYSARMERRLALERKRVLQDLRDAIKSSSEDKSTLNIKNVSLKRKRGVETPSSVNES